MQQIFKFDLRAATAAATIAIILTAGAPEASAVRACPNPITVTEPDGNTIQIIVKGDERNHDAFTLDGRLIVRDAEGYFTFADVDSEGFPAASSRRVGRYNPVSTFDAGEQNRPDILTHAIEKKARRAIGDKPKYLFSGNAFPATGEPHALVVLVEYTDKQFSMSNPSDFFTRQLNAKTYSDYRATGSAREYFISNSKGLFQPTFDVLGPITLKNGMNYYGRNDAYGNDMHPEEIIIEALDQLSETTDFSVYDHDGDGYIDNVFVIYAGNGEADSYMSITIWPHSAELKEFDIEIPEYNGVKPNRYGMTCELDYTYRRPDGIGTFVHEFSHVLGLPDLYNTVNSNVYYTPGEWSVLDIGPYNNQGRTPPNYSIHERYALNWIEPRMITESGDYVLEPIDASNDGFIISTEREDEFFLLECRRRMFNDYYLPNRGMLAWHIDFNQEVWDKNTVNNNGRHQYVDLVEADNKTDSKFGTTRQGDSFPGSEEVTAFGYSTQPQLASWDYKNLGIEISDIRLDEDGNIHFHAEVEETGVDIIESGNGGVAYRTGNCIATDSEEPIQVYDAMGRVIGTVSDGAPIEISGNGLYIVSNGKESVKIMF